MESNIFIFKTYCELAIVSNIINPEIITEQLEINPDRSFSKGEQSVSNYSGSIITKPHNLWAIRSKCTNIESEQISHHIEYLKSLVYSKKEIIKKYKEDSLFDISFLIWIETDDAGIGLDLNEKEISFINEISNRLHISLIAKDEIK